MQTEFESRYTLFHSRQIFFKALFDLNSVLQGLFVFSGQDEELFVRVLKIKLW